MNKKITDLMDELDLRWLEECIGQEDDGTEKKLQKQENGRKRKGIPGRKARSFAAAAAIIFLICLANGSRILSLAGSLMESIVRICTANGDIREIEAEGKGYVVTNHLWWMDKDGGMNGYDTLEDAEADLGVLLLKPELPVKYVNLRGGEEKPVMADYYQYRINLDTVIDVSLPQYGTCRLSMYAKWSVTEGVSLGTFRFEGAEDDSMPAPEIIETWESPNLRTKVITVMSAYSWADEQKTIPDRTNASYTMSFVYHNIQYMIDGGTVDQMKEWIGQLKE